MADTEQLKQELINKISQIADYDILTALRADVELYEIEQQSDDPYEFTGATEEEREALIRLDKGELPAEDELVPHEEFKKVMSRWLSK